MSFRGGLSFGLVVSLLLAAACSSSSSPTAAECTVSASDYPRTCSVDADCLAIVEISGCGLCACETGAINVSAQSAYQSKYDGAKQYAASGCFCPCEAAPKCCGGTCTVSCGGC
jgi:hypothetical protein